MTNPQERQRLLEEAEKSRHAAVELLARFQQWRADTVAFLGRPSRRGYPGKRARRAAERVEGLLVRLHFETLWPDGLKKQFTVEDGRLTRPDESAILTPITNTPGA